MRLGTYYRYMVISRLGFPAAEGDVLDVGCYDGFFLSTLEGCTKTGIDLAPFPFYGGIEYIRGDFLTYDFGDRRFERVYAFDVMEHVADDRAFMKKIAALLSEKGIVVISVPGKNISVFPSFLQGWVDRRWGHCYRRGYDEKELRTLVSGVGSPGCRVRVVHWEGSLFRRWYLFLRLLWYFYPAAARKIVRNIVGREKEAPGSDRGFLFACILPGGGTG